MEVWILVNNRAGRQHARENGEQVRRVFALGGARARVAYTDTVEEGAVFLQQAVEAQPDLLVCCGGDGTLSQALNVLQQLDAKLPLGYVPMGTTNDFAASLGQMCIRDSPNDPYSGEKEIEMIRKAMDKCGRPMVLSLSPGPAVIDKAWHLRQNANMWRITDDFWDQWEPVSYTHLDVYKRQRCR